MVDVLRAGWFCLASWLLGGASFGCVNSKAQPPGVPPTPDTVTRDEPGGDAYDPQRAALDRLLKEQWGWRNDKRDVFHFPLSDWEQWRRVRFWGIPAFVGFRYGDKHRAISALWARRLRPDDAEDPQVCLDRLEAWGVPMADSYHVKVTKRGTSRASWKSTDDVLVQLVDAEVSSIFSHRKYAAVVGATFAWPRVCVVYGYAFRVDDAEDVVNEVRLRYAREAFSKLTVDDPLQPPDGLDWVPTPEGGED